MWEECWRFETANFLIVAEHTPCEDNPEDHFCDSRDIDAIRNDDVYWFDARVRVLTRDGKHELGADYLSACAYHKPEDLFRHHASLTARLRALHGLSDPDSRAERSNVRAILANNIQLKPPVCYGEYGPDMIRQAIADARRNLKTLTATGAKLRAMGG